MNIIIIMSTIVAKLFVMNDDNIDQMQVTSERQTSLQKELNLKHIWEFKVPT